MSGDDERPKDPRDAFVDHLAHDLRNPLNTISMSVSVLRRAQLTEPQQKTLERIQRSSERLEGMVAQVAELLRVRLFERLTLERAPLELRAVAEEAIVALAREWPGRVRLEAAGAGAISGDAERLGRVVRELARNGLLHGAPEREVLLRLDEDDRAVRLRVESAGPVRAEVRDVLFEPLARALAARDKGPKGLGLSLYLAREIASHHGGTLEPELREDRTAFVLTLPRE